MPENRTRALPARTLQATCFATILAMGITGTLTGRAHADPPAASAAPAGVVNINTATAAELMRLPGVGPSRAEAIIAQRTRRRFTRIEELMRVRGIGRTTFRTLRPHLTVEGPTTLGRGRSRPGSN